MLLTRLGNNSKAVVTGDVTQTDLGEGTAAAWPRRSMCFLHRGHRGDALTDADVVRHPLVQEIIRAYDRADSNSASNATSNGESNAGEATGNEPSGPEAAEFGSGE